jgi:hypothetical protein
MATQRPSHLVATRLVGYASNVRSTESGTVLRYDVNLIKHVTTPPVARRDGR